MAKLSLDQIITPGTKPFSRKNFTDSQKEKNLKQFRKEKAINFENRPIRIGQFKGY